MIILITGPSASGKTTIGSILADKYGFQLIDGDQIIKDLGVTSKSWNKIHEDIFRMSLQMHVDGNVVITHVVVPDKFIDYQKFYENEKIPFNIVMLNPKKETLHDRSTKRTYHPKPPPPDVIDFFYSEFNKANESKKNILELDNSKEIAVGTVGKIVSYLKSSAVEDLP